MTPTFDARAFRDAVGWFTTGVTVITARDAGGTLFGVTANSFTSVSLDPPLILWSLDKRSPSLKGFAACPNFAVNILTQAQQHLSARFAASGTDKFRDVEYETWDTGCPILPGSLANLECRVETTHDGGDHVIFLGRVLRLESNKSGQPLLFSRGTYRGLGGNLGAAVDSAGAAGPKGIDEPAFAGLEPWFFA